MLGPLDPCYLFNISFYYSFCFIYSLFSSFSCITDKSKSIKSLFNTFSALLKFGFNDKDLNKSIKLLFVSSLTIN